mmetsp:Transcript_31240/g.83131  ORF Transcript_31240/g.83131 Transcript_31240/m.83131 type:complete len:458 (-) Transcript_31240:138-1511(-)
MQLPWPYEFGLGILGVRWPIEHSARQLVLQRHFSSRGKTNEFESALRSACISWNARLRRFFRACPTWRGAARTRLGTGLSAFQAARLSWCPWHRPLLVPDSGTTRGPEFPIQWRKSMRLLLRQRTYVSLHRNESNPNTVTENVFHHGTKHVRLLKLHRHLGTGRRDWCPSLTVHRMACTGIPDLVQIRTENRRIAPNIGQVQSGHPYWATQAPLSCAQSRGPLWIGRRRKLSRIQRNVHEVSLGHGSCDRNPTLGTFLQILQKRLKIAPVTCVLRRIGQCQGNVGQSVSLHKPTDPMLSGLKMHAMLLRIDHNWRQLTHTIFCRRFLDRGLSHSVINDIASGRSCLTNNKLIMLRLLRIGCTNWPPKLTTQPLPAEGRRNTRNQSCTCTRARWHRTARPHLVRRSRRSRSWRPLHVMSRSQRSTHFRLGRSAMSDVARRTANQKVKEPIASWRGQRR